MPSTEYDGYSVDAVPHFIMRYVEGHKQVDFFFDPGSGGNDPVTVYRKPTACSSDVDLKDVARALDRVVAHFTSIGYKIFLSD